MSDNHTDLELDRKDIQGLGSADAVAKFFARLGYNTNERVTQKPAALGLNEKLKNRVERVERLSDDEGMFQVYLFELKSVTVADTKGLAHAFRDVSVPFILFVLTTPDYNRLDFVLLDRESGKKSGGPGSTTVQVKPLTLTVGRRGSSEEELTVPLRVLRRFTWTEKDPFGQFDKLKAAYDIAHWSEPEFNNRALFADHFLRHRLPVDFPEWKEEAKTEFKNLQKLFVGARTHFVGKKESVVRKDLLEPAFDVLGFRYEEGKASGSDDNREDYVLFAKGGKEKLAFCLAYPWDRSLDFKDSRGIDTESPNEVPGTLVVRLLEDEVAPWGIVTNGRTWRLYSQKTHAKATNYYEIDLEEVLTHALGSKDFGNAFRYFWLFFRAKAFIPEEIKTGEETKEQSFLDRLLEGSESYAKKLGDALKERIFADIFPHLAEGFIRNIDQQEGKQADLSRERLDDIYEGTLVLLYRLLFLLYAESRSLLPVREAGGYWEISLARLKAEIAKKAGNLRGKDQDEAHLKGAYSESSYELYDRLLALFVVIEKGSAKHNVPVYNGGLFYTDPPKSNCSTEAEAGRFLAAYKVPDRQLALAIDKMARDLDDKRKDLVFIDYKSLGVRQLGSIYEGLLEFKLHVAKEKLGVKKEKGKEVFESFKKLKEKDQTRAEKLGAVIRKGGAYLENDKRERKATGSYYTPDYIVKYIVEHAVGPVLQEKFDSLRDRFREAEQWHYKSIKAARQKGEPEEKYRLGDAVENKWRDLTEDFFDIKVLDPAMGSGHFLVEVVDFVTDRALAFLRGFGWDPVSAHIDYMRETITAEMEKAGILLDEGRLTPVSLTKRQVLKRCVYGVDLNPMAVELAKVSLWLHCFTLGAPLSFLDHHLRCGNSLIGATEKEVEEARKGQMGLFTGTQMAAAKTAVGGMLTVSKLSDVTTEQVRESQSAYQSALDSLAPHKRLFDLHVSQWFENAPDTKGKGKAKTTYSPATEFLRAEHALEWARNPKKVRLSAAEQDVAVKAQHSADQHRFFHWELEFPEVFFGPRKGAESVIERKSDDGFDAVVGNPPFGARLSKLNERFLEHQHQLSTGKVESYIYLLLVAVSLCRMNSRVGYVTPNVWLTLRSLAHLRKKILSLTRFCAIAEASSAFDAWVNTVAVVLERSLSGHEHESIEIRRQATSESGKVEHDDSRPWPVTYAIDPSYLDNELSQVLYAVTPPEMALIKKLNAASGRAKDFLEGTTGFQVYHNTLHTKDQIKGRFLHSKNKESPTCHRYVSGTSIFRYGWRYSREEYVEFGGHLYRRPEERFFTSPKILIQEIASRGWRKVNATIEYHTLYADNTTLLLIQKPDVDRLSLEAMLGVFNSRLFTWFLLKASDKFYASGDFARLNVHDFLKAPIPWGKSDCMNHHASQLVESLEAKVAARMKLAASAEAKVEKRNAADEVTDSLDREIDAIVCSLYELTDEEVEMVEGFGMARGT